MKKTYLTLLLISCIQLLAFSQSDSTKLIAIASKLEKLTATHPIEKVYLHFNKPAYLTGDTIWFKAYLTIGEHHQPSALSGILYVEMIDGNDKIIKTLMLKVENGITTGDIPINNTLTPGDYRIRAYTNWMRNAGPDYFFTKTLSIGNVKTNAVFVNSTFNIKSNGGQVSAQLAYTDKLGRAYDHKEVSYELRSDTALIVKGKGITDERGILHLTFADKPLPKQQIITHVKLFSGVVADKTIPINLQNGNVDIQFFPEGGQLVNGVRSKVAFKAIGINGLGVVVNGVVTDNEHTEIAEFTTKHAGMGIFALTPQGGKTYSAKITLADSSIMNIDLPTAIDKGFVLSVNSNDSAKLIVRIATNEATLQGKQNEPFYLVAQAGGVVYYTTSGKWGNPVFTAIVPKSKFPIGMVQFTLFSATMEPINERVLFVNSNDQLSLNLSTPKPVYALGEKVSMDFSSMFGGSKPVVGSFSLTVYNEAQNTINENAESTILSNILLSSDLKGYIEQPNYYFNHPSTQTNADLDILMLTQGYRRFNWKEVMNGNYQQISYQPERSLGISGILTNSAGKPVAKGNVKLLSVLDKVSIDTLSDAEGKFNFPGIEFPDSTKLVIQARKANDGKNVNISLDDSHTVPLIYKSNIGDASLNLLPPLFSRVAVNSKISEPVMQKADTIQLAATIKANSVNPGNQLKEVTIYQKKIAKPDQSNLWGSTKPLAIISGETLKDYATITAAIMTKALGNYYKDGKIYDPIVQRRQKLLSIKSTPIPVVIDGFPIDPGQSINDLTNVDLIEDVKILQSNGMKSLYGINMSDLNDKVILITTKQHAGTNFEKADTIKNNTLTRNLKQVDIKSRKNAGTEIAPWHATVTRSANLNGPGIADQVIIGNDLHNCISLLDCLQSLIPGIIVKNGLYYFAAHLAQSVQSPPPIRYMVDGMFSDNSSILDNIIVDDIQTIEVLKSTSYLNLYGQNAAGGLLVITTKIGNSDNVVLASKSAPGIIYTRFNGYDKVRQFYVPKYTYKGTGIKPTDTRDAIYWNPNIITDNTGKCTLNFYNPDVKGTYRAIVEGIDNDGNIGRYVYQYRVE
jgi:hypothetical protein